MATTRRTTSPQRPAVGGRLVCPGDAEWPAESLVWEPERLLDAAPLALWVRGPWPLAEVVERSVAVVGARAASSYGLHVAQALGAALSERGATVVSGAAYGIDAAAHRGALQRAERPRSRCWPAGSTWPTRAATTA
jgi:DNA processing protein